MTILQEIFYNTAVPLTASPEDHDEWYKKAEHTLLKSEKELSASFDESQLSLYEDYKRAASRMDEMLAVDYFEQGFRIAVKLMRETFEPLKARVQCK